MPFVEAPTTDRGPAPAPFVEDARIPPAELAIHALAQLPDSVELELCSTIDRELHAAITEAYGLRRRVRFGSTDNDGTGWFLTPDSTLRIDELLPATLSELVEHIGDGTPSVIDEGQDELLAGERIVVVTNHPAHYRLPLFHGMARRLRAVGAHFSVLFLSSGDRTRPWLTGLTPQFEHEFLHSVRLPVRQRAPLVPRGLETRVRALRPTIVLGASFSPFIAHRTSRIARECGAVLGVWSGETPWTGTAQSRVRRIIRLRFITCADFAIAYGSRAAAYLRGLRSDLPLVIGRNTAPTRAKASRGCERRDGIFSFVLIGDLTSSRKGADIAIEAMRLIHDHDIRLSIVGGGRLLGTLAEAAAADPRITFLGGLSPEGVRCHLAHADALLFPTRSDVFGLAVVEAMGASLVPVVSTAAGAVDDLAVDQVNAIILSGHKPVEWATAIRSLAVHPVKARELGENARRTIEARWTIDHAVEGMLAGLRLGVGVRAATR